MNLFFEFFQYSVKPLKGTAKNPALRGGQSAELHLEIRKRGCLGVCVSTQICHMDPTPPHSFGKTSSHKQDQKKLQNSGIPGTPYLIAVFPLWPRAFSSGTRLGISSKWLMNSPVSSRRWSAAIDCPYGKWDESDPEATRAVWLSR